MGFLHGKMGYKPLLARYVLFISVHGKEVYVWVCHPRVLQWFVFARVRPFNVTTQDFEGRREFTDPPRCAIAICSVKKM